MSAVRYDNALRYHVSSKSRDGVKHLVEIDAYNGNGRCSCEHFTFHLERLVNKPNVQPSDATRCHHICEAREEFTNEVIRLIKLQQKESGTDKQEHQV